MEDVFVPKKKKKRETLGRPKETLKSYFKRRFETASSIIYPFSFLFLSYDGHDMNSHLIF